MPDNVETGKQQTRGPEMVKQEGADATDCATSTATLPPECEVPGMSSIEIEEGQPASGTPETE